MYCENIPTTSGELNTARIRQVARDYNATLSLAYGNPVSDTYQNHDLIDGPSGGIAERAPNLRNSREYFEGDFKLSFLPVINRTEPYLQGLRR